MRGKQKQQQQKDQQAAAGGAKKKKVTAAQLRVQKGTKRKPRIPPTQPQAASQEPNQDAPMN